MSSSRSLLSTLLLSVAVPAAVASSAPAAAAERTPAEVFSQLKSLEGSWGATAEQVAGEPHSDEGVTEGRFEFKVSAAGTVLMETMGAGSEHEMVNMYHMDGDDLVLTHYCAGGNQPTMKLDTDELAAGRLHFAFTGGTNLDPAVDAHIHSATISWQEDGSIVSDWTAWTGGSETAIMHFVLTRAD